ncbi:MULTISPECIES: dimethylarginine dimethylaminohydrolase family protein [unclassified Streptomyces]|uniref:dimethylarginine dimethylaminohydrolase family protein n=2 Tax=Streptomyces TaxID=1883 RepID=UPI0035DD0052
MVDAVHVESEFAPLRTVVLARSEFATPADARNSPETRFLPDPGAIAFTGDLRDADPARQSRWEAERDALGEVLVSYGVEILRPRLLTSAEKAFAGSAGYANFFARDPFFTIGDHVIEGSMRFAHRRVEVLPMRGLFAERVLTTGARYVATPMPEVPEEHDPALGPGPFLEGGDVLVLGRHVFVGTSGLASSPAGIAWLAHYLAPFGYTVESVRLRPDILHLDCALGLVREGLLVACPDAFLDGIPERLRAWDRIEVSLAETARLATNGLPVDPDTYVTDPEFAHIGEQLKRRGITVEYVDFSVSRSFGGSFRCSTQPLRRTVDPDPAT